jgi:hypothetical protein
MNYPESMSGVLYSLVLEATAGAKRSIKHSTFVSELKNNMHTAELKRREGSGSTGGFFD